MTRKVTNGLDLQNRPIENVATPSSDLQAANKAYVDGALRGLDWKQEVVAASTGNVNRLLPGTTLDGVNLTNGDRILLKDQTAPEDNGIYVWTGPTAALTRALDADNGPELSGATVTVQRGTVNADRVYRVTADDPLTVGTTPVTLVQVGAAAAAQTAGPGLTLTGSELAVGQGTGIVVDADTVRIDTNVVARKVAATIGNGAATSFAVAHNLGSRDVAVTVMDTGTFEEVLADVVHTDNNTVTVAFATAPANGAFRIIIHG
jgi:hypothetical protein